MGRSLTRALPALCAAALLAACVLNAQLTPPQLSVVGVQILNNDLWSQRLKVRMQVDNPNDRALAVKGLTYTIEVEGQQFASGESAASFEVPAKGQVEFDTNVTTNIAGTLLKLLARGPDTLAQGVAYRIFGKVSLSEGLLRSIPFDQSGRFNLQP
jgi:LEA14-like dessication related protein